MADRKQIPGKFVWFELVSTDAKKAQTFYAEVFGWKTSAFPMGDYTYEMILAGDTLDTMIGGYAPPPKNADVQSHWLSYVSVEDVDATAKAAAAKGGKVIDAPYDIPNVGRVARIADPQGAELCLFKSNNGDPEDGNAPAGRWVWNELHTTDPNKALSFYESVLGFSHRSMDMGPGGVYHIISKGGVDRGGVSAHLDPGVRPHWLPYVAVDDADATVGRAKKHGGSVLTGPENVPAAGRLAVIADPTGASIAILKPQPMEHQK